MKNIAIIVLLIFSRGVLCDSFLPDLIVGKTHKSELEENYKITFAGVNSVARLSIYDMDTDQIDEAYKHSTEINFVSLSFDERNLLFSMEMSFQGDVYETLKNQFNSEYTGKELTYDDRTFFGSRAAQYQDGEVVVTVFYVQNENQTRLAFSVE